MSSANRIAADRLLALPPLVTRREWTGRDTAIYNLGIGLGDVAAERPDCLDYVLEDRARSFPTMPTVMGRDMRYWEDEANGVDFSAIVHGEEWVEILSQVPAAGAITSSERIEAIWDKGASKAAVASTVREITDQNGVPFARCGSVLFIRGAGGFGGENGSPPKSVNIPDRAPDGHRVVSTRKDQALLYRLSGDMNPLHFDPAVAKTAGFDAPVLMGLCTMGIAAQAVAIECGGPAPALLRKLRVRFTEVVYPGEKLQVNFWNLPDQSVAFRVYAMERNVRVLDGGHATFG